MEDMKIDDMKIGLIIGFIIGIVSVIAAWIMVADQVEISKVNAGYLTFKNKTYKVTLFDSLDKPEKLDSKD